MLCLCISSGCHARPGPLVGEKAADKWTASRKLFINYAVTYCTFESLSILSLKLLLRECALFSADIMFQLFSLDEGFIGFFCVTQQPESIAFIVPYIGILWIDLNSLIKSFDRIIVLTLGQESISFFFPVTLFGIGGLL